MEVDETNSKPDDQTNLIPTNNEPVDEKTFDESSSSETSQPHSSGYNSHGDASEEPIPPGVIDNFVDHRTIQPTDYPALNLERDNYWRNSQNSFSHFIPASRISNRPSPAVARHNQQNQMYYDSIPPEARDHSREQMTCQSIQSLNGNNRQQHMWTARSGASYIPSHYAQPNHLSASAGYSYTPNHVRVSSNLTDVKSQKKPDKSDKCFKWRGLIAILSAACIILLLLVAVVSFKFLLPAATNSPSDSTGVTVGTGVKIIDPAVSCSSKSPVWDATKEIYVGSTIETLITPESSVPIVLYVPEAGHVNFFARTDRPDCSLVLMARQTLPPKLSAHDFLESLSGAYATSTAENSIMYESRISRGLAAGTWYLQLTNDGSITCQVSLKTETSDSSCPNDCSQNGICFESKCSCFGGWTGSDCSIGICAPVCSGNGVMAGFMDACVCYPGFSGEKCEMKSSEKQETCESSCKNGSCEGEKCICKAGFSGENCETKTCLNDCSSNGVCVSNGKCRCFNGYSGADCSFNNAADESSESCSGNGLLIQNECFCDDGFTGQKCETKTLNEETDENCFPKCENDARCVLKNSDWKCECKPGTTGVNCGAKVEQNCIDGLDNDNDWLVDCEDPDCCSNPACIFSSGCKTTLHNFEVTGESTTEKIQSLAKQLKLSSRFSSNEKLAVLTGIVEDENLQGIKGVSVKSRNGEVFTAATGHFIQVQAFGCEIYTFERAGFKEREEMICTFEKINYQAPLRLSYKNSPAEFFRLPPPALVTIQSDFSTNLLPNESLSDDFPVDLATRKVSFSSEILDGTLNLRLMEDPDEFSMIYVTFQPTTPQARVIITCDGAEVFSETYFKLELGKSKQIIADWNFSNIFQQTSKSIGSCQIHIGSRYDLESEYTWSSSRVALVKAQEPDVKQKTAVANFVPDFISYLDRENGIIFHQKDNKIQRFSMQLEKELSSTVKIQVDDVFESDIKEEIIVFSKSSGIFSKSSTNSLKRLVHFQNAVGISKSPLSRDNTFFVSFADKIMKVQKWRQTLVYRNSGNERIGKVVALSDDELIFVRGENELVKISNGKLSSLSRKDGLEEPCRRDNDFRRMSSIKFERIKDLQFDPSTKQLLILDERNIWRVSLRSDDNWTRRVISSSCGEVNEVLTGASNLQIGSNSAVLISNQQQVYELLGDSKLVLFLGSCTDDVCDTISSTSAAKFGMILAFRRINDGFIVVDESSGAVQIWSVKPSEPTKSPSGYEVGFPDENLIREYLPDGRLVVVKDIYTRKTLKILTYKNNRLEQIADHYKNTIKITYESNSRILLQNSHNRARAQIMLRGGRPVKIEDEDGSTEIKWGPDGSLMEVGPYYLTYIKSRIARVSLNNFTVDLSTVSSLSALESYSVTEKCTTRLGTVQVGSYTAILLDSNGQETSVAADATVSTSSSGFWKNIETFSRDPITSQPSLFGLHESRGFTKIPDRTTEWISTLSNERKNHVTRMRREGATLMSYELDYSKSKPRGKTYDQLKTFTGTLDLDPAGAIERLALEYSQGQEGNKIEFSYASSGALVGWKQLRDGVKIGMSFTRDRGNNIVEVNPQSSAPLRVEHRRNQLKVTTAAGSTHELGYKLGNSKWSESEITRRYPSGQEFSRVREGKTSTFSRNGISFLSIDDQGLYRKITNTVDGKSYNTVELYSCSSEIRWRKSPVESVRYEINEEKSKIFFDDSQLSIESVKYKNLLSSETISVSGTPKMAVTYAYDSWHRINRVILEIPGYRSVSRVIEYDGDQVYAIDKFSFFAFPEKALIQISSANPRMKILRKNHRSTGRLVASQLKIADEPKFQSQIEYNSLKQVQKEIVEVLSTNNETIFNTEKILYRGELADQLIFPNGKLVPIGRDHLHRLTKFGDIRVTWTGANHMTLGSDKIEVNYKGQPVKINDDRVHFDSEDRPRALGTNQFFIFNGDQLLYHVKSRDIIEYFYDPSGHLFAIAQKSTLSPQVKYFYVMTTGEGSPAIIFDEDGKVVKEVRYGAFGRIAFDSNPKFEIVLGYSGRLCLTANVCQTKDKLWIQTLTGESFNFAGQIAELEKLGEIDRSRSTLPSNSWWPYSAPEARELINSKRDRLVVDFFKSINIPIMPEESGRLF
ncbi:Oidioi.mRNA.OKI2018_I69.PAR.g8971.t1.cds [Oikopleura dioica]|uniref:Oidioi.mRNA.OKI2018_I69.PAR.g8971.t1.cds n=1 Tax=Oikopleura dioica TaxID=34765 RepID=A0ABN7RIF4_OIKDI|nr:Oidioi.mRNA.OKI2018_I69.PAR.g8971.t1.cds [Oikopleura dioica]